MPFATIASAVSRTTFSLRPLHANLFQLFQPIGGVFASPLSKASAREDPIARDITTSKARTAEDPTRIVIILSKRPDRSKISLGNSNSCFSVGVPLYLEIEVRREY